MNNHRLTVLLGIFLVGAPGATAAAPDVIEVREPGTNLFAGVQKVEHVISLRIAADFRGRLTWRFAAANGQILPSGRGEAVVAGKGAEPVVVKIALNTPQVKPGVVLDAQLDLSLFGNADDKPEASLKRKLHIYPPDPFVDRTRWLKGLGLVVFDSSDKSRTVSALEALKIPHDWVKDVDRLLERKEGVILIGEGTSFKEERGLGEALVQLAQRGCKVVCLAAAEGKFAAPGIGADENAAAGLTFQRHAVIRRFDKRLDSVYWSSKGPLVSQSIYFTPEDGKVVAEVRAGAAGWPWIEAESAAGGRLIFCQFALMRHWDFSPTPRYLLARILESLSPEKENLEPK